MKVYQTIILIILIALSANAENLSIKKDKWHFIPLVIPEGKAGGGDFYNVRIEPESSSYQFKTVDEGINILFKSSGNYSLSIVINHITKSSCAGVKITPHTKKDIQFNITK